MEAGLRALAEAIITGLRLEDVTPEDLDPSAPLFGGGLGLDSIDALELSLIVERSYGVKIGDAAAGRTAFSSLEALHAYILAHRPAP